MVIRMQLQEFLLYKFKNQSNISTMNQIKMTGKHQSFLFFFIICSFLGLSVAATFNIRNLDETDETSATLWEKVNVLESSTSYFYYEVYTDNGDIKVQVLDQDLTMYTLTFCTDNTLYFRDAYNKFIIVEQKDSENNKITYWVLTVAKTEGSFQLDNFKVNSIVDDEDYQLDYEYLLTGVIEYNQKSQFLYVKLDMSTDIDVYGIDLANKGDKLKTVGWFFYSLTEKENIVGGNSRVLVQATKDQFWFDIQNIRVDNIDPTIYDKVNITQLTQLPLYPGGSRVFNLLDSYFQYVSLSADQLKMTTFTFKGYKFDSSFILGEGSLNSLTPIKFFSDQQTYFIAAANKYVYSLTLVWNNQTKQYDIQSNTLQKLISDQKERKKWVQYTNQALLIIYQEKKFYLLTKDKFLVFSKTETFEKVLDSQVTKDTDLQSVLFMNIKEYKATH